MPHHNPYQLNFFLFKSLPKVDFHIIKTLEIPGNSGGLELAIIGSSHYFRFEKLFCELLTCQPTKIESEFIYSKKITDDSFSYEKKMSDCSYLFQLQTSVLEEVDFFKFEGVLLEQENTLSHAFYNKSALTVLRLGENQDNRILLQTWHTYPENFSIVETQSTIIF